MATITVRDFRASDLQAAAELLAASHGRAEASSGLAVRLGDRFFEPRACRQIVEQLVASPRSSAVVAEDGGVVRGFLAGERQLFAPEDFASIYAEPRSTNIPLHGHAVAGDSDAAALYGVMFASLSATWAARGHFIHNVAIRAGDGAAGEAWAGLGFGRKSLCGLRSTQTSDQASCYDDDIGIEEIRGRDDKVLESFHRKLMMFQTEAPMFWPYVGDSDARVRNVRRDAMVSGQGIAYVARDRDGEALGALLFVPSVFLSPLLVCEKMVYLWEGFVEEDHRASGVGTRLLDFALAALRERGLLWCAVHYVSGNPRGGRFWPARGFQPVEIVLRRHVDERVAWARGTES